MQTEEMFTYTTGWWKFSGGSGRGHVVSMVYFVQLNTYNPQITLQEPVHSAQLQLAHALHTHWLQTRRLY